MPAENENSSSQAVEYIMSFSHSGKPVKDLSRIKKLLSTLGDPQEKLRFVHIAGTNGKGSMAQMFSEIFTCAGLKTGLFTSPYIIEYADRIRVNNVNISYLELEEISDIIRTHIDAMSDKADFSQFEITQAAAFLYFVRQGCDIVVLETGLGGLLDCTNVINTPLLTVIGSVDYDHTAILGDTIEEIAFQKAGIIKPGIPCVLSAGNDTRVVKTVKDRADILGSRLIIPDKSLMKPITCGVFGTEFEYKGRYYRTVMGGQHQIINAMAVIEGSELISDKLGLNYDYIQKGIGLASIPGRTEVISKAPLIILDGAHNPDGMAALADLISRCDKRPCRAVIGMCMDKNMADAVSKLLPLVESFVTVDGFSERAEDKHKLAELINSLDKSSHENCARPAGSDLISEVEKMCENNKEGLNLICGSLFLAAKYKQQSDVGSALLSSWR